MLNSCYVSMHFYFTDNNYSYIITLLYCYILYQVASDNFHDDDDDDDDDDDYLNLLIFSDFYILLSLLSRYLFV